MFKQFTFALFLLIAANLFAQHEPIQPFEELGVKVKVLTLSNGKYQESFPNDTIQRIGSVMYNRVTGEVVSVVVTDTLYGEYDLKPEVVSRWLSPDPLAAKYSSWSPYNYAVNNPIRFIDRDGLEPDIVPLILGAWAVLEIGLTIYDVYDVTTTLANPNATTVQKLTSVGGAAAGIFLPGGGYSAADDVARSGVKVLDSHADEVVS
jgi:hypothetical protein